MKSHQLINQTSGLVEYGSPPNIVEAVRAFLGGIDLDPATSAHWNKSVNASAIYTREDDGLNQKWFGRVWMNHPFGSFERACKPNCKKKTCPKRGYHLEKDNPGNAAWVKKIVTEYGFGDVKEAVCITFASTSETWFRPLLFRTQCFLSPRTNYVGLDGKPVEGVSKGSVLTYFGNRHKEFDIAFRQFGVTKLHVSKLS